jgi:hypothetical protein
MSLVKICAFRPTPGLIFVDTATLNSLCNDQQRIYQHPLTARGGLPTGAPVFRISGTDLVKIRTFTGTTGKLFDEKRINKYPVIDPNGHLIGVPVPSGLRGLGTMIVSGGLCE